MHSTSKYKYPPMERPLGSGIWGRPTLADNLKHLAWYSDREDRWSTWCGQDVPADHRCPPLGWRADGTRGAVQTCLDCDQAYKKEQAAAAEVKARAAAFAASMAEEVPPVQRGAVRITCGTCGVAVSPEAHRCKECGARFYYPSKG